MNVPILDLRLQYQTIRQEVLSAIEAVCDEQAFVLGPRVVAFEREVAQYLAMSHAVGVASGSDALLLGLMAANVAPGDEVITVPFTFFATAGAISRLGAVPVFVDISPDTFNLDPSSLEAKITPRTKAIIPVHLFGQCANMEAILEVANRHHLMVIEDACQAIGAARHGIKAGAIGHIGTFSFFPTKNLGGFGDGGLVTTNDPALAETMAMLRVHGSKVRYVHELIGINSRLDALQAAVLRIKLKYLDQWTEGRRHNAARYLELFSSARLGEQVVLPTTEDGNYHVYNQFTIRVRRRDALRDFLKEREIGSEVYYPIPLHLQTCYQPLGHTKGAFPHSERAAEEVLSLPIFPELSDVQLSFVVESIAAFYRKG
jgi:dTDP-4-amino-4,6-dideoxygalactose transaminase